MPLTLLVLLNHLLLRVSIWKIAYEKASLTYAFETDKMLIKVAEDGLSYKFCYEEVNNDFKNASLYFLEKVLIRTDHCGTLIDLFGGNIYRCTKSSTFMDASTGHALPSSPLVLPVVNLFLQTSRCNAVRATVSAKNLSYCSLHHRILRQCQNYPWTRNYANKR